MKFTTRIRERRIAKIEKDVVLLNAALEALIAQRPEGPATDQERRLREVRRDLWLKRSKLIAKLPPVYEGAQQ